MFVNDRYDFAAILDDTCNNESDIYSAMWGMHISAYIDVHQTGKIYSNIL